MPTSSERERAPSDTFDATLDGVAKSALVDASGRSFAEVRKALRPRWGRVAFDVALGYAALAGTALLARHALAHLGVSPSPASVLAASPSSLALLALTVLLAAVSFGYWMAYLQLFIHEAAHFNLAPGRKLNDLVANALVGVWVGAHIENYRAIHWEHHRLHGEPGDTEHSYFSALDARFLAETLLLVRAFRVVLFRKKKLEAADGGSAKKKAPKDGRPMLLLGMATHGALLGGLVLAGLWPVAIAWIMGMAMFFPFFGALRQLLEHRSTSARRDVDYATTPHGKATRMFREGLFASTFGGAGFTRHLLHHWEPAVSYTNLAEVERFLEGCEPTRALASAKTTYLRAFVALYGR